MRLVWIAMAGALGVLARYGLSVAIQGWLASRGSRVIGSDFPLATLFINVSGAFLLSFLTALVLQGALKPDQRLIWGTGFCGGYTTFSTFELEAEGLLAQREWSLAGAYIMGNLILGFVAVLAGRALAIRMLGVSSGSSG